MDGGVLTQGAEKTGRDIRLGNEILMAHAAGGGKGVINKGEVVEEVGGGEGRGGEGEGGGNREETGGRRREKEGLVGGNERGKLGTTVGGGLGKEIIANEGDVDGGTRRIGEVDESTIFEVAIAPEVNGGGVAVVADELTATDANGREERVIGRGGNKRGAGGKERNIEGPEVLQRGADGE